MNKRIAEALVQCRYADRCSHQGPMGWMIFGNNLQAEVQVFADTLEGYKQSFALQDWLWDFGNEGSLWNRSEVEVDFPPLGGHRQWQKDRIKYCFEQVEKDNEQT